MNYDFINLSNLLIVDYQFILFEIRPLCGFCSNSQIGNKLEIPDATDKNPILLIDVAPAYMAMVVVQVAVPGVVSIVLSRTPPATAAANIVECPSASAVNAVATTARKTCKAGSVIFC